jgi:hypothetical protein
MAVALDPDEGLALLLERRPFPRHRHKLAQPTAVRPEGHADVIGVVRPEVHYPLEVESLADLRGIAVVEEDGQAALYGLVAGVQRRGHLETLATADQVRRHLHVSDADRRLAVPPFCRDRLGAGGAAQWGKT